MQMQPYQTQWTKCVKIHYSCGNVMHKYAPQPLSLLQIGFGPENREGQFNFHHWQTEGSCSSRGRFERNHPPLLHPPSPPTFHACNRAHIVAHFMFWLSLYFILLLRSSCCTGVWRLICVELLGFKETNFPYTWTHSFLVRSRWHNHELPQNCWTYNSWLIKVMPRMEVVALPTLHGILNVVICEKSVSLWFTLLQLVRNYK